MFYGEYEHNLDIKGRLVLPAKFREVCRKNGLERFFLTRGLDQCIFMFTEEEWSAQEQKFKSMPFTKQESRGFNRLFFSGAVDIFPDRQGRFVIPNYLKDYAHIQRDTVVVGVSNRIEIWSDERWRKFYETNSPSFEKIAENILEL
jgi:MraZ protein